jgi:chorismate mutase
MRLVCACGFFRDIASYTTNGNVPFTCAKCVAEIERRREVAEEIAKAKLRQQRTTTAKPKRKVAEPKLPLKVKRRFGSRKEMLEYIRAGLAEMER